jgi:hypothetical protein
MMAPKMGAARVKHPGAVALGRLGGLARAARLSPEELSRIAKVAARARWPQGGAVGAIDDDYRSRGEEPPGLVLVHTRDAGCCPEPAGRRKNPVEAGKIALGLCVQRGCDQPAAPRTRCPKHALQVKLCVQRYYYRRRLLNALRDLLRLRGEEAAARLAWDRVVERAPRFAQAVREKTAATFDPAQVVDAEPQDY